MTAISILSPVKFCKKCQCDTDRYNDGRCKPCASLRSKNYYEKNAENIKSAVGTYRINNPDKINKLQSEIRLRRKNSYLSSGASFRFCVKCETETERTMYGECKICAKVRDKNYKTLNADKVKEKYRKWRLQNKEWLKETERRRWKNKSKDLKEKVVEWRHNNPDKVRSAAISWRGRNQAAVTIHHANRRARKKAYDGQLSKGLAEKLLKLQRGKCACCGKALGDNYHLDHIIPLALGGTNTDDNIQLLLQRCNSQKHAKHPIDFMQSRGFLL